MIDWFKGLRFPARAPVVGVEDVVEECLVGAGQGADECVYVRILSVALVASYALRRGCCG